MIEFNIKPEDERWPVRPLGLDVLDENGKVIQRIYGINIQVSRGNAIVEVVRSDDEGKRLGDPTYAGENTVVQGRLTYTGPIMVMRRNAYLINDNDPSPGDVMRGVGHNLRMAELMKMQGRGERITASHLNDDNWEAVFHGDEIVEMIYVPM